MLPYYFNDVLIISLLRLARCSRRKTSILALKDEYSRVVKAKTANAFFGEKESFH